MLTMRGMDGHADTLYCILYANCMVLLGHCIMVHRAPHHVCGIMEACAASYQCAPHHGIVCHIMVVCIMYRIMVVCIMYLIMVVCTAS